jgi:hypothetical protein
MAGRIRVKPKRFGWRLRSLGGIDFHYQARAFPRVAVFGGEAAGCDGEEVHAVRGGALRVQSNRPQAFQIVRLSPLLMKLEGNL